MRVSDYGGHCYNRGCGVSTGRNTPVFSYRCTDSQCRHLTYYTAVQINRMKSQPRCGKCGGTTEETDPSYARRTGMKKKDVPQLIAQIDESVTGTLSKPFACPHCAERFRSMAGWNLHIQEKHNLDAPPSEFQAQGFA